MKTSQPRFALVLTAALLAAAPAAWAQNPAKLLAYWNFNNASDPAGTVDLLHSFAGSLQGGAAYSADAGGFSGQPGDLAMDFGATSAGRFVRVPTVSFLNGAAAGDQMTVAFWQKLYQDAATISFWMTSPSSPPDGRGWNVHVPWSDGNIYYDTAGCCMADTRIALGIGTFPPFIEGTFAWTDWHHFTFVKAGETKQIYIDGILFHEVVGGARAMPTDFTELSIGSGQNGGSNLQGLMDDFTVFGSALDPDQISALAAGASPTSLVPDTDGDGMPNWWEDDNGLNSGVNDAAGDGDADGLNNLVEYQKGTNPSAADSDGDGLKDGVETGTGIYVSATNTGTDALKADTDGDGLNDGAENNSGVFVNTTNAGSNPHNRDTDGDRYNDGLEGLYGGNPVDSTKTPKVAGESNLLVWWNFDDATDPTATLDEIHNVRGDLMNGATFTPDTGGHTGGPGDLAMDFGLDGAGEHVRVNGDIINIGAVDDQVTVAFWQKLATTADTSAFWMYAPSAGGARGFQAHVPWSNNNIYYDTAGCCGADTRINASITTFVNYSDTWTFSDWHHFAFVKNGTTKQIYIDGVLFLSGAGAAPLPIDFNRLEIGTGSASIRGVIDDFVIYASALNEPRIRALFSGAAPDELDDLPDTDGDGMPNVWEESNGLLVDVNDAALDPDADSSTNLQEYQRDTNPQNPDTDADGLLDGVETGTGIFVSPTNTGSNPNNPDTDSDGLTDLVETGTGVYVSPTNTGTDPNEKDTDGDAFGDGLEITLGTNPLLASSAPGTRDGLNLLAYWDFDDDSQAVVTLDVLHGYSGDLENGAAFTADGLGRTGAPGDKAMDLGPTNDRQNVHVVDGAFVNVAGSLNKMTVSLWAQLYQISASSAFWFNSVSSGGAAVGNRGFQVHIPWSDSVIYFDSAGCCGAETRLAANISSFPPFIAGTFAWTDWHHYVLLKNGDQKQIWIDGQLFLEGTGTADLPTDFSDFRIGSDGTAGGSIQGLIDDFAIYASGLTPSQIAQLFSGVSPTDITPSPTVRIAPGVGKVTITFTGILQASDTVNGNYIDVPNATSPLDVTTGGSARFFRTRN